MIAFHNDPQLKSALLAQLAAHRAADELVKGIGWEDGKGCSIGCSLHVYDHMEGERRFDVPVVLWRLNDAIFEGLPNEEAQLWPERFIKAISVGADLSRVGWRFLHWLLTDKKVNPGIDHPLVSDAVAKCAELMARLARGEKATDEAAESAADAADAAASAESAAASAESAAASAKSAAWSAESAAASAAWSAKSAAWAVESAESAARSAKIAAWSAESAAASAESAAASAESAAWTRMANKLIELMEGCR